MLKLGHARRVTEPFGASEIKPEKWLKFRSKIIRLITRLLSSLIAAICIISFI